MRDAVYSLRTLWRQPRYSVLAVLTLAAGIGVTSAMFGLLDALYFRPLPIASPHRLVDLTLVSRTNRFGSFSYEEFKELGAAPGFTHLMAIGGRGVTLNRNGQARPLLVHYVSGQYFPSLAIPMHLGRGFATEDDRADGITPQVVINHALWQNELGSPPDIIGRTVQLNNTMFTVIGVTGRGFVGLDRPVRTDVWVTIAQAPFVVPGLRNELTDRRQRWFRVVGRLADGLDVEQVRAGLDVVLARWRNADSREYADATIAVALQDERRRAAALQGASFLGLAGLVLLIACGNVANLTLARHEQRSRETALRSALGATRVALMRQMLVESAVVSAASAVTGMLLAAWLVRLFPAMLPPGASMIVLDIRLDARFVAFAGALALAATLLVGLLPAWRGSRADLSSQLRMQTAPRWGTHGLSLRDLLIVSEIALSGMVVIAAGLLVRSLSTSLAVNPGFTVQKSVATFYVVPSLRGYDTGATYRFLESARRAAATVPGVTRASYGLRLPAQGNEAGWAAFFTIPGKEPPPGKDAFQIRYTIVGPTYFEVMGTRVLSGRGIAETDGPDAPPVAVISDFMARQMWPGESPLGRRIRMGRTRPLDHEIVGVAEDIRIGGLHEAPEMYVYVAYAQHPQSFGLLIVETGAPVATVVAPIKEQIAAIDANVPVLAVSSFADHRARLLYEDQRNAWIGLAVAVLALTLGAIGVYGVVSLVTARRTREIAIRVALGAERRQLLALLLGKGAWLAGAGTVLGIAGGLVVGRLLRSQLHGIDSADPWTIVLGTCVLVSVAFTANFLPAWRASRIDPAIALRHD